MAESAPIGGNDSLKSVFDDVLVDGTITKAEFLKLAEKEKEEITNATTGELGELKKTVNAVLKTSLEGMIKEYTLESGEDFNKLKALAGTLGLKYNFDQIKPGDIKWPTKVRLDKDGTTVRTLGGLEGIFTPENEHTLDVKSLLALRKAGHIDAALKSSFYPIAPEKKRAVEDYIEDKFSIMNAAIESSDGGSPNATRRAQEAYADIIYCVTHAGATERK